MDPDGKIRIKLEQYLHWILIDDSVYVNIVWRVQYLWIQSCNICVYNCSISVNMFRSWNMSQGYVKIVWEISVHDLCKHVCTNFYFTGNRHRDQKQ